MLKQEIQDAVDFEVALTKLVIKRSWAHNYTALKIVSGKSSATVSGVIKLTDTHDDSVALRNDIRHQIAHLITGVKCGHNFAWQFMANKLGVTSEHIKLKAKETVECTYCGEYTVFVKSRMCHTCKQIHETVTANPELTRKILEEL